jgi:hypothetical protein
MKFNEKFSKKTDKKTPSTLPQKKKALKKAAVIVACVLASLAVLCALLYFVEGALKKGRKQDENAEKSHINYYNPDYDENIFDDAQYLEKNRNIYYEIPNSTGSVKIVLDEYEKTELDAGQKFFKEYFDIVIGGKYEEYRKLFAEEYVKNPDGFEKHPTDKVFSMQRIYDINVKELAKTPENDENYTYNGKAAVFGVYELSYKIMKNDGEFRTDVESDMALPVIVETVTTDVGTEKETTLIKNIYRYKDIS